MDIAAMLRRLFFGSPPEKPPTRLSEAQAISLAKQAASEHWLHDKLNIATAARGDNGAVVWIVETGGVGSHLTVIIDDATGTAIDRRSHDGR